MPRAQSDSQRGGRMTDACSIQRGSWLVVGEPRDGFDGERVIDGLQVSGAWMASDTMVEAAR